jgi:hypothetical protein
MEVSGELHAPADLPPVRTRVPLRGRTQRRDGDIGMLCLKCYWCDHIR